jgi:hypothetical protein
LPDVGLYTTDVGTLEDDNLRSNGAIREKVEDCRLRNAERVMWKADTSKVISPVCVG